MKGNYVYVVPPGWTEKTYPDGIVLSSPVYNTGEKCSMTLFPMRASSGNLQNDATLILFETFKGYQLAASPNATPPSMIRGISSQGWEYFIVKKFIKPAGDYAVIMAFTFVAKLGNQLGVIVGSSKDPMVSSCFGELQTDMRNNVWPKFFYSLQFKNWRPQEQEKDIMKRMAGVWVSASATAGDRFAFASNGRFAGAAASQKYFVTSTNELLTETDAFFGDGVYSIRGNQVTLIHDSEKNNPETGFIRVEQESKDDGRTWLDKLYLLRKSVRDGSEYEVNYDKQ